MDRLEELIDLTPAKITFIYLLLGSGWILLTDQLVSIIFQSGELVTWFQTLKGWLFVGVSGLITYTLVSIREKELQHANKRSQEALQQTSVLHRVLRHNLRNVTNIIEGNMELIADELDEEDRLKIIKNQTKRLMETSQKSSQLRRLALEDDLPRERVDLVPVVDNLIDKYRSAYPSVEFETELPERAFVIVISQFEEAIGEVIENAIKHSNEEPQKVWISIETRPDKKIAVDIADNGPGIPEMERDVIESGVEKPLFHSEGIGLWLVHFMVKESNGELHIQENSPHGAIVRLILEKATQN